MTKTYPLSDAMRQFVEITEACFSDEVIDAGIDSQRKAYVEMNQLFNTTHPAGLKFSDEFIQWGGEQVRVRRYHPVHQLPTRRILFVHGGGWYLGNLNSHDFFAAKLAHDCQSELVSVDYRLAPEAPFPASLDDIYSVYRVMINEASKDNPPLLVGDSAGANLIAALSLRCRDEGLLPAAGQVLIYPGLSQTGTLPSHQQFSDAPLLSAAAIEFCWRMYQPDNIELLDSTNQGYLIPNDAEHFTGLPPARLYPVEFDPLKDDAFEYVRRLKLAGVDAELSLGVGLVHGCLRAIGSAEEADQFYQSICAGCDELFVGSQSYKPIEREVL